MSAPSQSHEVATRAALSTEDVTATLLHKIPKEYDIATLAVGFETRADCEEWRAALLGSVAVGPLRASLRRQFSRCRRRSPCANPNCALCARAFRRWLTCQAIQVEAAASHTYLVTVLLYRIPVEKLPMVRPCRIRKRLASILRRADLRRISIIGGIEAGYRAESDDFVLHAHLLVASNSPICFDGLRQVCRGRAFKTRAVKVQKIKDRIQQLSYLLKFAPVYRHRLPRGSVTKPLTGEALNALCAWRRDHTFGEFVFVSNITFRHRHEGGRLRGYVDTTRVAQRTSNCSVVGETRHLMLSNGQTTQHLCGNQKNHSTNLLPSASLGVKQMATATSSGRVEHDFNEWAVLVDELVPDTSRHVQVCFPANGRSKKAWIRVDAASGGFALAVDELNRSGANLLTPSARAGFVRWLEGALVKGGVQVRKAYSKMGWNGDHFVLPNRVLPRGSDASVRLDKQLEGYANCFHRDGKLRGWKDAIGMANGNSRLLLALALGFVGPLGRFCSDVQAFGVQLVGEAGTGKSTIGVAATSIWGYEHDAQGRPSQHGGATTWNSTAGALELMLAARNCTLAVVDETAVAIGDNSVSTAAFVAHSGRGRRRMTEQCQLSWFCCLLSSSNVSTRVGAELSRALADRMIEVGPPQSGYGFFDDLHGHGSAGDFSAALLGRLAAHHGKAGPEFVKSLMSMHAKNGTAIDGFVKARRSAFLRRVAKAVSLQREHERVTGYFASIYAAGALAAHLDVFPVKREALVAAVMSCLSDHIARTGGQQGDGFSELARRLRMWLQKQRVWVVDLDVDEPRSCDGLDAFRWTAGGKARIGLRSELLDEILGGRSASATFKHELHRRNAIATAGGGKSGMKYVVKRAIGKERVPLVQIREDTIRERP